MDLVGLKTFCRTVELGNLTAAAKALHITKSVASRRIQALEDDVGVRLLSRTTRGVNPTDAGLTFYERCLSILADLEDARQSLNTTNDNIVGHLRITAPLGFTDQELHRPITAFMAQHPGLTFDLHLSDEQVDILSGGYDMAIRITQNLTDTSLIARKLATLNALVVASPSYLEMHGTPQTPEDLKDHNCVFYANMNVSEQWRFQHDKDTLSVRVKGGFSTNSGKMQLAIAKEGFAIAALPGFIVNQSLESGDVVAILNDWPRPDLSLYALYPERRLLPLKVRAFVDFLSEWFANPINIQRL
jgi:DNA-binding transcriptional LysR family regulator